MIAGFTSRYLSNVFSSLYSERKLRKVPVLSLVIKTMGQQKWREITRENKERNCRLQVIFLTLDTQGSLNNSLKDCVRETAFISTTCILTIPEKQLHKVEGKMIWIV